MFKSAEEKMAYELGKILGRGMAEGYLEKIAEELEALQQAELEAAGIPADVTGEIEPETDEPDFDYEASDEDPEVQSAMQLRETLLDMTPEEIVAWYNSLDDASKNVIDNIPEIRLIVEQAHASFNQPISEQV